MKFGKPDWALPRTGIFGGSASSPSEPLMQYVRLKKEGIGMWIKGQVTEVFPPEDGVQQRLPWSVTLTGVGEPNNDGKYNSYEGTVWPGHIGGVVPANIFNKINVSGSGTSFLVVSVTTGNGRIQSAQVSVASNPPSPPSQALDGPPSQFSHPLGVFKNGEYFLVQQGNVSVGVRESLRVSSPAIIQSSGLGLPYKSYYTWDVS